jgi:hypothetical protein
MGFVSCVDVANVPTITFVMCIEVIPFFLPFVYLFRFDFVQCFFIDEPNLKKHCVDVLDLAKSSIVESLPILLNLVIIVIGQHVDMQSFGLINL